MIDAARRAMPNVAQLANRGVKMTNAFVAHPVCGPSRAGIFTGRYPASFGTYSNDDAMLGVPLDITLLPALFQKTATPPPISASGTTPVSIRRTLSIRPIRPVTITTI